MWLHRCSIPKGFGSAADLGVRLCHSSLVVAVDGLVLEDFVSAGVHCGVLVHVYWASPAHGWHAWLIMISVGAVSLIMIGGGGLCVPLPCCSHPPTCPPSEQATQEGRLQSALRTS